MERRKLITDKKEVEKVVNNFFSSYLKGRLTRGLTYLSKKHSFGEDYQSFSFKHSLDEYDMSMLQKPMTDRHILVFVDYPAAEEDCEAYISFEDFYEYLEKAIHQVLKRSVPEGFERLDKNEILQLLGEVKIALEI